MTPLEEVNVRADLQVLADMRTTHFQMLWENLRGISETELDWQPHPAANSVRWIMGHLIWFEEWVPDAITGEGRYLTDEGPLAYKLENLEEIRSRFERARERLETVVTGVTEADLAREVNYFGAYTMNIMGLLRTHVGHLAGHRYQVRYIRGTYSRAHRTNKAVFDRW